MSIGRRIFNIANAAIGKKREEIEARLRGESSAKESDAYEQYFSSFSESEPHTSHTQDTSFTEPPKDQTSEDLSVFDLSPGADWDTVKNAYRRECKKYHSDLHQNDVKKKEAAEEIMVIFNSAYGRLKKKYGKK